MSAIDRRQAILAASSLAGLAIAPAVVQAQAPAAAPAGGGELARIRQRGTLRVGAAVFSPVYIKPPTGDWQGVAPDIMRAVGEYLKVKVEFVETQWGTAVAGLQTDRFDVMSSFAATPERALAVGFTRPMGAIAWGLLVTAPNPPDLSTWEAANNPSVRVAGVEGSASTRTIESVLTKAQWVKVQSFDAVILEIESGRAQIAVLDSIQAKQYIARRRRGQFILPTPKFESDQNLAVRSGADDLKEWLNVTLRFMEQRGELGAIWDKYLNMA
jgi:polar amino acid transport system substrate-binding protein